MVNKPSKCATCGKPLSNISSELGGGCAHVVCKDCYGIEHYDVPDQSHPQQNPIRIRAEEK